jgi:1,4-alpha-glucan branching enzyme
MLQSSIYGPDGFKMFVRAAGNFAVILDGLQPFRTSNWTWQFDGWQENDGRHLFYNDPRRTPGSTRLDYGARCGDLFLCALMWLEEYHVDGLRYDITLHPLYGWQRVK